MIHSKMILQLLSSFGHQINMRNHYYYSILLLALLLSGCRSEETPIFIPIDALTAYDSLLGHLEADSPGRGLDVFNESRRDRPMAYGLITSAEANRYRHTSDSSSLDRVRTCGNWLLENQDLNNNSIPGYGLADSWDAFSDGSINPVHNEYTITTAIAMAGLIDWHSIEPDTSIKHLIYEGIFAVSQPYLNTQFDSPLGIPAYSFSTPDLQKDVYNPAVYLAGQLMRFAAIAKNDSLSNLLRDKSQSVMDVLFAQALKDTDDCYFWNYGTSISTANDLVHACYIIEGIREYEIQDGQLPASFERVFCHLYDFQSDERWYEYVEPEYQNSDRNARLWGLGMLMYSMAVEGQRTLVEETLWPQIEEYHLGNGRFRFKEDDDRQMVRQDAHLLLGLSFYLYN